MIVLEGVEVRLGSFRLMADLAFPARAIVALIGPSGAGKSALLSTIAGFLAPERGRVLIGGEDVTGRRPAERPVTMLFQEHNLFPQLRVWQNVGLGLRPDLRLSREERAAVEEALASVGLGGLGSRRPAELSGGQRSRVALARALLRRRPVLLLDEPFAALGPALKREMLDLVQEIAAAEGMTVLMVTHDPGDARRIASHAAMVAEGRVEPPVPVAEFFGRPGAALREYLGE
ncbi:MAG TPA: ATP-binding cassette domain-containing protein [Paracoccaceae bacterium]|nr:ATP-binding cassette domain-containing protein [Paracoccaceae bacterium]